MAVNYLFSCIYKFSFPLVLSNCFFAPLLPSPLSNLCMQSEVTCFICKKFCLLKCEDRRFMGCTWGGIRWACEQANEFMDKAKGVPSRLCQSQRSEIGVWAGFLCLVSFNHFFFLEIIFLNPDAYQFVLFCYEFHIIIFWGFTGFIQINVIMAVTIFGKWFPWGWAMDCSNNIMLWLIWCAQEFSTSNKFWNSWYERAHERRKQFSICLGKT